MMHIPLAVFWIQTVQCLFFAGRAESSNGQHLGFAALEKTRSVHAGKEADISRQRPKVVVGPRTARVAASAVFDDEF